MVHPSMFEVSKQEPKRSKGGATMAALFGILTSCTLMSFAVLRETSLFWRNAGGYPIWLRDTVLHGFHPLIFISFICLAYAIGKLLFSRPAPVAIWYVKAVMILIGVLFFSVSITFAVANNVANMIDGRPFHSHWH